jgi:hypothetical protein
MLCNQVLESLLKGLAAEMRFLCTEGKEYEKVYITKNIRDNLRV